ncbi:hypothetical protein GCM10027447_35150 [Glycomyces halotolerans]
MSRRRERRRRERIRERTAARCRSADIEELLTVVRPHLAAIGDDLAGVTDPFEAELAGGAVFGVLAGFEELDSDQAMLRLVEEVALQGDTSARALLVFMSLGPDPDLADLARGADSLLDAAGVTDPVWAGDLFQPVEPVKFTRITVPGEPKEAWLLAVFRRADEDHGFLVGVDYGDCGAITQLDPIPPDQVSTFLQKVDTGRLLDEIPTEYEDLSDDEARYFLDGAITTTLDHWSDETEEPPEGDLEADLLPTRLILLTRRLTETGLTGQPPPHGAHVPERYR